MAWTPRVTLAICPIWAIDAPPLGLASLQAYLRQFGYPVTVLDLNVAFHKTVQARHETWLPLWSNDSWKLWDRAFVFRALFPGRYVDPELFYEPTVHLARAAARDMAERIAATNPDVVGFTVMGNTALITILTALALKKLDPRVAVVFGGPSIMRLGDGLDPTSEFFLRTGACDAAVMGEGEATLVELLQGFARTGHFSPCPGAAVPTGDPKTGPIAVGPVRQTIDAVDSLPVPDFTGLEPANYTFDLVDYDSEAAAFRKSLPVATMLLSRGCLANCTFCADKPFWEDWRARGGRDVVAEVAELYERYGVTSFNFNDLMINGNLTELEAFCDGIIETGVRISWGGSARAKPTIPPRLMEKMRASGCHWLSFGFEHFSDNVLRLLKKGTTARANEDALLTAGQAGIRVSSGLIIGTPGETEADLNQLVDFCTRHKEHLPELHPGPLSLMPGAPLFTQRDRLGIEIEAHHEKAPADAPWADLYTNPFIAHWTAEDGANTPARRDQRVTWVRDRLAEISSLSFCEHGEVLAHAFSPELVRVQKWIAARDFANARQHLDAREKLAATDPAVRDERGSITALRVALDKAVAAPQPLDSPPA